MMSPSLSHITSSTPTLVVCALLGSACGDSGGGSTTGGADTGTDTTAPASTSTTSVSDTAPTTGTATQGATTDLPTSTGTDSGVSATGTTAATTGDTGDTTTGTGTTDTTTGTTTGDTTTGDTTTGEPDDLPTSCLAADFPVMAALCGANGPACQARRDELVSPDPAFRNDMPALALRGDCGPAVLYSEAVGGYFGFYSERSGGNTWSTESTPMTVATGSLEVDPVADEAIAVVDDGAFGVSLWRRSAGAWKQTSPLAGMNHARAAQLARDDEGTLHLAHIDSNQQAQIDRFDGAWSKSQIDKSADIRVRVALDAAAAPRLTYWSAKEATWKLYFAAPPALPEVVMPLQSNGLERAHTGLALAGPDSTPWVWAARQQKGQFNHELVLLHRVGPAKWAEEVLIAEDALTDKTCDFEPAGPGQQCAYDYLRYFPLALFAADAEVRAVYSAINYKGTLISQCQNRPFPNCVWVGQSDTSTAELRIAWPGSAPQDHQVIADDVFAYAASGRLDPGGYMHLAFYDQAPGDQDPLVRYMAIGP